MQRNRTHCWRYLEGIPWITIEWDAKPEGSEGLVAYPPPVGFPSKRASNTVGRVGAEHPE